jgi:HEAT repeat protein
MLSSKVGFLSYAQPEGCVRRIITNNMDSSGSSQTSQVSDCVDDFPSRDIPSLIKQLSNADSLVRMEARDILSCIGAPAVPELLKIFPQTNSQLRWQIIKIFDTIQDPSTIPILLQELKDDNAELRWAASNALINLRRELVPPLLEALTHDFDSLWLRQSAHHILRVLKDNGKLTPPEEEVYKALEGIEPAISVPWAAIKALAELKKNKNNLH